MPINKKEVEALKAEIRAHAKWYNQNTFGDTAINHCGTEMCIAGFCLKAEIGTRKFNNLIKKSQNAGDGGILADLALEAGARRLGIRSVRVAQIFLMHQNWPLDLDQRYGTATNDKERAEVACEALDRLNVNGTIAAKRRKRS